MGPLRHQPQACLLRPQLACLLRTQQNQLLVRIVQMLFFCLVSSIPQLWLLCNFNSFSCPAGTVISPDSCTLVVCAVVYCSEEQRRLLCHCLGSLRWRRRWNCDRSTRCYCRIGFSVLLSQRNHEVLRLVSHWEHGCSRCDSLDHHWWRENARLRLHWESHFWSTGPETHSSREGSHWWRPATISMHTSWIFVLPPVVLRLGGFSQKMFIAMPRLRVSFFCRTDRPSWSIRGVCLQNQVFIESR